MTQQSHTKTSYWKGFGSGELPTRLNVPAPPRAVWVAKGLLVFFCLFMVVSSLAPWTQNVRGFGRVMAYAPEQRQQPIEATIDGRVERWFVQEGSRVSVGDPIVKLSDNDASILERLGTERAATEVRIEAQTQRIESLRDRVQSLRRVQRAELDSAQAQVLIAQQELAAKQQAFGAAQAEKQTNDINLRRQRDLKAEGLASQRELELAELAARQSNAAVASAKAAVRGAKQALAQSRAALERASSSTDADIANAEANLKSSETDLATATGALARLDVDISRQNASVVRATVDGTILRVVARQGGEQVKAGDTLAILVPNTDDRAVELHVDGNDAALIQPGAMVRIQFEGWPAVQFAGWPSVAVGTFGGRVAFVDAADNGRGDFRVVVVADENDDPWPNPRYLRQGVLAKGWFLLNRVRLGYELWRRLNGFPPIVEPPPGEEPLGAVP